MIHKDSFQYNGNREAGMKVFASDFDGTLRFYENGRIFSYDEDSRAVRSFQQNGGLFGICTGRPLDGILAVLDGRFEPDFYLVSSGAVLAEVKNGRKEIIRESTIPLSVAKKIYNQFKDQGMFYFHDEGKIYSIGGRGEPTLIQASVDDVDRLPADHITGLSIGTASVQKAAETAALINAVYGEHVTAFQNVEYLDIIRAGQSKGTAVQAAKQQYHADLIFGIGDSFNDIPMLDAADVSFTFRSSPPEVRAHADHEVDSVAEAIAIAEKI